MSSNPGGLSLHGVDHTAFPTAKPKETIEFYRDTLGLPVLHAITAKGWGWSGARSPFSIISALRPRRAPPIRAAIRRRLATQRGSSRPMKKCAPGTPISGARV
jgi:catechol 2,3-dioxygenase-like lactoylglutathione lyase family enzyme